MKKILSFFIIPILILLHSIQIVGAETFGPWMNNISHDGLVINGKTISGVKEVYAGFEYLGAGGQNSGLVLAHKNGFIEYQDKQDKDVLINLKGEIVAKGEYQFINYYDSTHYTLIYKKDGENQYSVYNSFLGKDILTLPALPQYSYISVPENGENPYFLYATSGKSILNVNGKEFVVPQRINFYHLEFSKDYKNFAFIIYDTDTDTETLYINGKEIKTFKKQSSGDLKVAFARDGKYYALYRNYSTFGKYPDIEIYQTLNNQKVESTKLADYNFNFIRVYCDGKDKKTCKGGKRVLNKNGKEILHLDPSLAFRLSTYKKDPGNYYRSSGIGLNKIVFNPDKYIYLYLDKSGTVKHYNINGQGELLSSKFDSISYGKTMLEKDFKYYYGVYEKDGKSILNLNGKEVEKIDKSLKPRFYISKNKKHYGYIYEKGNKVFLNIDGNRIINIPKKEGLILKIGNNGRYYYTYKSDKKKGKKYLEVLNLNGEYETHISSNRVTKLVVSEDMKNFIIAGDFINFNINGHDILNTEDYPWKNVASDGSAYTYAKEYSDPLKYVTVDFSKYPLNKKNSNVTFPQKVDQNISSTNTKIDKVLNGFFTKIDKKGKKEAQKTYKMIVVKIDKIIEKETNQSKRELLEYIKMKIEEKID